MKNPFESAKLQIESAYEISGLKGKYDNFLEIVKNPKRVIEVNIPVEMDNGNIKIFKGYRSQHNEARGPFKGGVRFHQGVNKDEVMALSAWMSIKTSVVDIPLGGGKGGIIVNPKELSKKELEKLSRGYVKEIFKYIGPENDIPAPDVNTTPEIMAWMMDEYSILAGKYSPGSFTGKPLSSGGSKGRAKATAQGGVFSLLKILELECESINGKKIIVQGAGNAGLNFISILESFDIKLLGISDSKGAIYDKDGIDIQKIIDLKNKKKSVTEYSENCEQIGNDELLEKDCDILIPAALENQITKENAKKIKAKIVLELANGPTTPEADEILFSNGVNVIPDILANAGGVMVSYFEQVQNNTNFYWEEDEIEQRLKTKMEKATIETHSLSKKLKSNLRKGAYSIALKRIFEAMNDRK